MATVIPNEKRLQPVEWQPVVLHLKPAVKLDNDQFFEICQINRDLRIKRNAQGELLIMPPTGGRTSERNAEITMQLRIWAKRDDTGVSFDSSGACAS